MGTLEAVAGPWRLVATAAGDVAEPAPLVRFRVRPTAGGGVVEVELGPGCRRDGPWRAGPSGSFLAGIAGGSGDVPERFLAMARDWTWARRSVAWVRDGEELVLRDRHGDLTGRLVRPPDAADDPSATGHGRHIAPLPGTLRAAERHEVLGTWRPVGAGPEPRAWQHLELHDDGTWRGSGPGARSSGPWVAGPHGELLAIHPYAVALGFAPTSEPAGWLLATARAGFDRHVLVLLDDDGVEVRRLTR